MIDRVNARPTAQHCVLHAGVTLRGHQPDVDGLASSRSALAQHGHRRERIDHLVVGVRLDVVDHLRPRRLTGTAHTDGERGRRSRVAGRRLPRQLVEVWRIVLTPAVPFAHHLPADGRASCAAPWLPIGDRIRSTIAGRWTVRLTGGKPVQSIEQVSQTFLRDGRT